MTAANTPDARGELLMTTRAAPFATLNITSTKALATKKAKGFR